MDLEELKNTISFGVAFLPFNSVHHQPLELLLGFWAFNENQDTTE